MEVDEVDLVLVYRVSSQQKNSESTLETDRKTFEDNLLKEGLIIETTKLTKSDLIFLDTKYGFRWMKPPMFKADILLILLLEH